jgi:thioredoxin 1
MLNLIGMTTAAVLVCVFTSGCSLGGKKGPVQPLASKDQPPTSSAAEDMANRPAVPPEPVRDPAGLESDVALASFHRPAREMHAEVRQERVEKVAAEVGRVAGVGRATSSTFDDLVLESDVPVLVDFYADWCRPCKALAPALDELARELPDVRIVKVDIDDCPDLAARYQVRSIPSLQVFRRGEVTARHVGRASKQELKSLLTGPHEQEQISMAEPR